jgi:hypothetical protein
MRNTTPTGRNSDPRPGESTTAWVHRIDRHNAVSAGTWRPRSDGRLEMILDDISGCSICTADDAPGTGV